MILQTSEYHVTRQGTIALIPKLKEAGVYLDHLDYSGLHQAFLNDIEDAKTDVFYDDIVKAIEKYCYEDADEDSIASD